MITPQQVGPKIASSRYCDDGKPIHAPLRQHPCLRGQSRIGGIADMCWQFSLPRMTSSVHARFLELELYEVGIRGLGWGRGEDHGYPG